MSDFGRSPGRHPFVVAALRLLAGATLLWVALFLAWQSLSSVNFFYALWYELLEIDKHIERYAPQNYYKSDFETTDVAQRQALFGEIVTAINRGGEGLAQITYTTAQGQRILLLREPEVVHLQSVALLIDRLRLFSYLMLGGLALSLLMLWRLRLAPPRPLPVLLGSLVAALLAGLGVIAYGAEEVFNTAHELVFPPGEQWFFYYQESLMTTLMKAPDLFAALAVLLVVAALAWFGLLLFAVRRLWPA